MDSGDELWEDLLRPVFSLPRSSRSRQVCPECQPLVDGAPGKKWKRFAMCPHRWKEGARFGKVRKNLKKEKMLGWFVQLKQEKESRYYGFCMVCIEFPKGLDLVVVCFSDFSFMASRLQGSSKFKPWKSTLVWQTSLVLKLVWHSKKSQISQMLIAHFSSKLSHPSASCQRKSYSHIAMVKRGERAKIKRVKWFLASKSKLVKSTTWNFSPPIFASKRPKGILFWLFSMAFFWKKLQWLGAFCKICCQFFWEFLFIPDMLEVQPYSP